MFSNVGFGFILGVLAGFSVISVDVEEAQDQLGTCTAQLQLELQRAAANYQP